MGLNLEVLDSQKEAGIHTVILRQLPDPKQIQSGKYRGREKQLFTGVRELKQERHQRRARQALNREVLGFLRDRNHLTKKCALGLVAFLFLCSDTLPPLQCLQGNPSQACYL